LLAVMTTKRDWIGGIRSVEQKKRATRLIFFLAERSPVVGS